MTVLVGIKCQDGVVIGSDSATTFSDGVERVIEQPSKKIEIIEKRIILACTGAVGLEQRFSAVLRQCHAKKAFSGKNAIEFMKAVSKAGIDDFIETHVQFGNIGALVAFPAAGKELSLCELALKDFQPELKDNNLWYGSMGGGQRIADPFLGFIRKVFWQDAPPNLSEGIFAALWTLNHVIDVNPGGVNGPAQIATLRLEGGEPVASILSNQELQEHNDNVSAAESYLREYRTRFHHPSAKALPEPSK